MFAIKQNAHTHELRKLDMLRKWKEKKAWKATYRIFIEALLSYSKAEHARDVCELLAQSKYFTCDTNIHVLLAA